MHRRSITTTATTKVLGRYCYLFSLLVAYCCCCWRLLGGTAFLLVPSSSSSRPSSKTLLLALGIDYDKDYSVTSTTINDLDIDDTNIDSDSIDTDDFLAAASSSSATDCAGAVEPQQRSTNHSLSTNTTTPTKIIYGIRHGISISNEWILQPENTWGVPTYCDSNGNPRDAPLSAAGVQQATALGQALLQEQQQQQQQSPCCFWLDEVELIVVSPLTRCLQTYQLAVAEPMTNNNKNIPVLAHPWATERVYTIAEIGRPSLQELQDEFPTVDFSLFQTLRHTAAADDDDDEDDANQREDPPPWWYDPKVVTDFNRDILWTEWRPHAEGQRYGAYGEPKIVFQRRMDAFQAWLAARPEQTILVTAHWGVFRHFLGGREMNNCQVCRFELASSSSSSRTNS